MSIVLEAILAKNRKEAEALARDRRVFTKEIRRKFGRQFARRIQWDEQEAIIDGVRFRAHVTNSYYGWYASIEASFGGDSWASVTDMPSLGRVLQDRLERVMD